MKPKQYLAFCRDLHKSYSADLNCTQTYLHGNPVLPLPPLVANPGGVMVIGAYPTAKFATIGAGRDVPVSDIDAPFSNQTYFDGANVRDVRAGAELLEHYIKPLGLTEQQLWLTNLVKIFLFKPGHVAKYKDLSKEIPETRSRFNSFAEYTLKKWLPEEIAICSPKAVLLLGEEVCSVITGEPVGKRVQQLFDGQPHSVKIGEHEVVAFCLPHPGIVMRQHDAELIPERINWAVKLQELLPEIRTWLDVHLHAQG
jgi:uracil-DNA glycosylase